MPVGHLLCYRVSGAKEELKEATVHEVLLCEQFFGKSNILICCCKSDYCCISACFWLCADLTCWHFTIKWFCSAHQAGLMNYGDRQEDGEHLVNRNLVEQWLVWMNAYPCSWADPVCGRAASVREAEWRMWGKGSNRDKHRIPSVMSPLSCLSEGEGYCRWVVEQQAGRDTWVSRLVCEESVLHFQEKRGAIRGPQRETLTELTSCRSPDGQPDSEWVCVYMLDFALVKFFAYLFLDTLRCFPL